MSLQFQSFSKLHDALVLLTDLSFSLSLELLEKVRLGTFTTLRLANDLSLATSFLDVLERFLFLKLQQLDAVGKQLSVVVDLLARAGESCQGSYSAFCGVHFC